MHQPRKRFGQNFLQDSFVLQSIVQAIAPQTDDNVLEIGPGLGALTSLLLEKVKALHAVEIDRDLCVHLMGLPEAQTRLHLVCGDALLADYTQFGQDLRVVGNLPYNISTPLLILLLRLAPKIKDMHFMLQEEVADRLAAKEGCKSYGRLSVMAQHYCEVTKLFRVPPDAFYPAPKVNSAVVRLTPIKTLEQPLVDFAGLEMLVAKAFAMRRKTIANNLKSILSAKALLDLNIDPQLRPEQIPVHVYAQLAAHLSSVRQ